MEDTERRYCKCDDWEVLESQINNALFLAHSHGIKLSFKPFKICPYCGIKLIIDDR